MYAEAGEDHTSFTFISFCKLFNYHLFVSCYCIKNQLTGYNNLLYMTSCKNISFVDTKYMYAHWG